MTRKSQQTRLSQFDLMVIRAGGRTQAELETAPFGKLDLGCKICAFLADNLYKIVIHLEAIANRSVEESHRRFFVKTITTADAHS